MPLHVLHVSFLPPLDPVPLHGLQVATDSTVIVFVVPFIASMNDIFNPTSISDPVENPVPLDLLLNPSKRSKKSVDPLNPPNPPKPGKPPAPVGPPSRKKEEGF